MSVKYLKFHCSRCGKRLAKNPILTNEFGWCPTCEGWAQMSGYLPNRTIAPKVADPIPWPQVPWNPPFYTTTPTYYPGTVVLPTSFTAYGSGTDASGTFTTEKVAEA